ncbi:MAG: 2-C-methyl-D-erythritol 2,4-cyclodiphosphate synthase [Deltaproteobacteria bacterium]|nr:2-C-methyl-D-erythritol 2,4-cyclodiphosphate synthase [Deltaproteobacteria bacterium]
MRVWAILLAAGQGSRAKKSAADASKQFLLWKGLPLFWHSALTLSALPSLEGLVLVLPEDDFPAAEILALTCNRNFPLKLPLKITPGGILRQDSVWSGLRALPPECTDVLVHDSARPFISCKLAKTILDALREGCLAVVPGLEPGDTIKEIDGQGLVTRTPPRASLRGIQTPQGFKRRALHQAHSLANQARETHSEACFEKHWLVTDDAALLEKCSVPVLVIPGDPENRKITTVEDLALLKEITDSTDEPARPCVGFGYDVHRYGGNRPFILGGVRFESTDIRLQAHSDGDVLLHALIDALLGCIGGGDIGVLFPDTNAAYDNISSAVLLAETLELTHEKQMRIMHVDLTVAAEAPKISPYRLEILKNIAKLLQIDQSRVNLKATTEEGLGFTGAKQGIKAMASVIGLIPAQNKN